MFKRGGIFTCSKYSRSDLNCTRHVADLHRYHKGISKKHNFRFKINMDIKIELTNIADIFILNNNATKILVDAIATNQKAGKFLTSI